MVVYSENNKIKYHWCSHDFPYKYFKEHSSKKLPPLTVAGDYFINANDWFSSYEDIRGVKLFEKCIYPTYNNVVISIIWQ